MESPLMKKPCTTGCPLPEHVLLEEIVKRLPTKSVIRFRSVSKTWHSRIIAARRSTGEEEPGTIILGCHQTDEERARIIFFLGHNQSNQVEIDTSYIWQKKTCPEIIIIGCCNGLVCLHLRNSDSPNSRLVLWNPATREVNYVPGVVIYSCRYSLGFDAQTDDHKIVRLEEVWSEDNGRWVITAQIFSKRGGHWRELTSITGIHMPGFRTGLSVDGAIYWIGHGFKILRLDTSTEEFGEFEGPEVYVDLEDFCSLELVKWRDSLGAVVGYSAGWELWLRNKDSWTKISTFDDPLIATSTVFGDHIIVRTIEHKEFLHHLVTKENRELDPEGVFGKVDCLQIFDHFPSLVSPN